MITVLRSQGLQIAIYKDDHDPPHVHVYCGGKAKIVLVGGDGRPELVKASAMTRGEIRKALRLVTEHRNPLLQVWSEIHGGR